MVDVADLKAKVKIEDDSAVSVLDKLEKKLEEIGDSILSMDQNMQELAKRGAESMGFLGHSMAFAFGGLVKDSISWVANHLKEAWNNATELAQNLDKLHFGTGIDILSLQRMRAVLEQNGISFEDFLGSLGRVQDMLARMKYNKLSQDELMAFGRLGINPTEYRTAESLLKAIGDRLNRINDIGERNFLAGKLKISQETLRGLQAKGWYDEFAALTEEEKNKMAEYARLQKALGQEVDATFTKFVSKFITGAGQDLIKWLLEVSGEFNKIIDEANTFGDVLDSIGDKINKKLKIKEEDSTFTKGLKFFGQVGMDVGRGVKKGTKLGWRSIESLGGVAAWLLNKDVKWSDVEDAFGSEEFFPDSDFGLLSPKNKANPSINNRIYNDNKQANITINNTGTVDSKNIKEGLQSAGFGSVSYVQSGSQ